MRRKLAAADQLLAPLAVFVSIYVATLLLVGWLRIPLGQWQWIAAVGLATLLTVAFQEGGRWPLGLFIRPSRAAADFLAGSAVGALLVGSCAGAIVLTTGLRHVPGDGFPWREVLAVYLPAALHEELLFRGYPFQKLLRWHRATGILLAALIFAALHSGNSAVTALGLINVFLGGVLLGLAFERTSALWMPIGIHLAWNVVAGPLLGHEVSGYVPMTSVLREAGSGSRWLTGGEFGIEGSVWMTLFEAAGIILFLRMSGRGSGSSER